MSNLLSNEYQKNAARRLYTRFVIAGAWVAIALALIAFLSLAPSYFSVRFGATAQTSAGVHAPSSNVTDRSQIQETQALATQLAPLVTATTTPTQLVLDALEEKPAGVSIDQVTYNAGTGHGGEILLAGSAKSPDLINTYKTTLSQDPRFATVQVPLGALVGASAGSFTLTLTF